MFVFPYSYPFESLPPVVVGRYLVDSAIMLLSHKREYTVVDLTLLISAHQGTDSSSSFLSKVTRDNFLWNAHFVTGAAGQLMYGILSSNYLVL